MAIRLSELIANPKLLEQLGPQGTTTTSNGLYERTVSDGWVPTDKYYEEMGREIEQHPICSPRVRRG